MTPSRNPFADILPMMESATTDSSTQFIFVNGNSFDELRCDNNEQTNGSPSDIFTLDGEIIGEVEYGGPGYTRAISGDLAEILTAVVNAINTGTKIQ